VTYFICEAWNMWQIYIYTTQNYMNMNFVSYNLYQSYPMGTSRVSLVGDINEKKLKYHSRLWPESKWYLFIWVINFKSMISRSKRFSLYINSNSIEMFPWDFHHKHLKNVKFSKLFKIPKRKIQWISKFFRIASKTDCGL